MCNFLHTLLYNLYLFKLLLLLKISFSKFFNREKSALQHCSIVAPIPTGLVVDCPNTCVKVTVHLYYLCTCTYLPVNLDLIGVLHVGTEQWIVLVPAY